MRVDCSENSFEQIEKQMHKLVNVLRVTELPPGESVEAGLALITVTAPPDQAVGADRDDRSLRRSGGDVGRDAITFQIVGRPEELDAFEELVRPHGVRELVRTGGSACAGWSPTSQSAGRRPRSFTKGGDSNVGK